MTGWLSLLGHFSIGLALALLGLLSQRMGQVTNDASYHIGFYIAAGVVWAGTLVRFANGCRGLSAADLHQNLLWLILYNGLPAAGITLGVSVAWRYWSWLLADRD